MKRVTLEITTDDFVTRVTRVDSHADDDPDATPTRELVADVLNDADIRRPEIGLRRAVDALGSAS